MLAVHRLDGQLTVYVIEICRYIFTGGQKFGAQPQSPYQGLAFPKVILKRALHVRYGSTGSEEQFMKSLTQLYTSILLF